MGLQCSRQGYIQEFHELKESRIAPEGECFSVDLLKSNRATPEQIKRLSVLLQDDKLAKRFSASLCINNFDNTERVLCGKEESESLLNEKLVALPPEGQVANDAKFVELPNNKHIDLKSNNNLVVDLPSEECASEKVTCNQEKANNNTISYDDTQECKDSSRGSIKIYGENRNHSNAHLATKKNGELDEEQWMYTLYDFQENGFVTKQDVNRLMNSICSVVNSTLSGDPESTLPSDNNNFKVHLQIGRRKKSKGGHHYHSQVNHFDQDKIRSKQLPADKCSKRYLPSRKYKGMIFPPPNTKEAEKVSSYIEEKVLSHRRCASQRDRTHHYNSRKGGEELPRSSPSRVTCRKCTAYYDKSNGDGYLMPKRRVSDPCLREGRTERVLVTTQPLIHKTNSKKLRYKKIGDSCDVSNSDHSLSPSSMSGCNTPFSADEILIQDRRTEKEAENSRFRHSCSCRRKPRTKNYEDVYESNKYERTLERDRSRQLSSDNSNHDEKSTITDNSYDKTRNEHRKKFRRHTNETSTLSVRPEVWPGGTASVVGEDCATMISKPTHKLCFCKRMLGLDYPCNHPI